MAFEVLKAEADIARARAALAARGASCLSPAWQRALRRHGLWPGLSVGDPIKAWDVWKTVTLVESDVPRDAPVLDIGACSCEVIPALYRLGYGDLTGVDLDPAVLRMPALPGARWLVSDFHRLQAPDASYAAVTAISVIEHGYDEEALFAEVSRVLRPGGLFLASFDYWPQKIDTAGVLIFGLDWRIFSEDEARRMIEAAARRGLEPVGPLSFAAAEAPVACMDRRYTFAWLALRKRP